MTVRAKTLVKDKFWIVEQNGQKLGTLQKQEDNGWIFLSKQKNREVFHTQESLFTKFGFGIFDESNIKKKRNMIQEGPKGSRRVPRLCQELCQTEANNSNKGANGLPKCIK